LFDTNRGGKWFLAMHVEKELLADNLHTDQTERMLAEEIIREKLFLHVHREIPFSIAVRVEQFQQEAERGLIRISAVILVERDAHKAIVIGAGGTMLRDIGTAARLELEQMLGAHVFLQLFVKADPGWTKNPRK